MKKGKFLAKVSLALIFFGCFQSYFLAFKIPELDGAALTSASATLSNSRLSFYGKVNGAHTAGDTTIAIDTSGNADNNTNNLFPNDTVSVGPNGNLTVGSIIDSSNFTLSSGLTVGASDQDPIYATQSSTLNIQFNISNNIPANGYIKITLPDPATNGNDGAPDTAASTDSNGFDLNGMDTGDVATSGGTGCTWGTETLTAGTGSGHIYKSITTTACTGGTITVDFDGATNDLVNPAPTTSSHTQGTADVYSISIGTYDSSDQLIDSADVKIAFVEAVLVSATVEESLYFKIEGVASGATNCGTNATTDVTTHAYSVPFGSISSSDTFYDAEQKLTVSTNADDGYKVRFYEDDELGKDGADTPYIPDTSCDTGPCTHTSPQEWVTSTNNGFGYSLQNSSGTDAKFEWDDNTPTNGFKAKQLPNYTEGSTQYSATDAEIMTNNSPVSGSSAYVCYRLSVSGTQEAGYYFNKVTYIATATF